MPETRDWPDLTLFSVFSSRISNDPAVQQLFLTDAKHRTTERVGWNVMRFAAAIRSCTNLEAGKLAESFPKWHQFSQADIRAIEAMRVGELGLITQLCSDGGMCSTMETMVDGMEAMNDRDAPTMTVGRGRVSSAAAGIFVFGQERLIEAGTQMLFHGRMPEHASEAEARARADNDFRDVYLPQMQKISTFKRSRLFKRRLRQAAQDAGNARLEFTLKEDELLRTNIATSKHDRGALWHMINRMSRVGSSLSKRIEEHPIWKFFHTPTDTLLRREEA